MTNTQKNAALIAAGMVAGALLLWLLFGAPQPKAEEDGIRVKGGSIELLTVSGAGFRNDGGGKFKLNLASHNCVSVAVANGNCDQGDFFARKVDRVTLTTRIDNNPTTDTTYEVVVGREFAVKASDWTPLPASGPTSLSVTAPFFKITAYKGSREVLSCTTIEPDASNSTPPKMQAHLDLCN